MVPTELGSSWRPAVVRSKNGAEPLEERGRSGLGGRWRRPPMAGYRGGGSPKYEEGQPWDKSFMPQGVMEKDTLLFAVPKKGRTRIHEDVMKILKGAGVDAKRPERLDVAMCKDLPIKLVFLPAADIPSYVMEGNVDIGISGSDMLEEAVSLAQQSGARPFEAGYASVEDAPVEVVLKLGIGKCKLCLQAPENHSTHIKEVSGSVEAACGLGLADAVVDLVETGTTMKAAGAASRRVPANPNPRAGLDIVADVLETEALLFQQRPTEANGLETGTKADMLQLIEKRIAGYLTATKYDDLAEVCSLMPGKRSPTVTELKEDNWHSVSALVKISDSTLGLCVTLVVLVRS
eukprot:g8991.t1